MQTLNLEIICKLVFANHLGSKIFYSYSNFSSAGYFNFFAGRNPKVAKVAEHEFFAFSSSVWAA